MLFYCHFKFMIYQGKGLAECACIFSFMFREIAPVSCLSLQPFCTSLPAVMSSQCFYTVKSGLLDSNKLVWCVCAHLQGSISPFCQRRIPAVTQALSNPHHHLPFHQDAPKPVPLPHLTCLLDSPALTSPALAGHSLAQHGLCF